MGSSSYLGAIGAGKEHDFAGYFVFPASSAQKRLWFLCQLEPESNAAYNVTSAVRMTGELNRLYLQQAIDAVIARHESLRTGIGLVDGEPQQVVAPTALVGLPMIDCSTLDPQAKEARLRLAQEELARAFVLHEPPLVRMVLLRMAADEHVLIVTIHHTVCDGWSIELFFRDLARGYGELLAGGTCELPEPPIQYADYVAWQDEQLAGERMSTLLGYWRSQLAGVPPLDLPTDRPRPPVRTVRGAIRTASIPADLVERLTRRGQEHDATLFMVLLAAFKLLLAHVSGQRDIAVGTPVAGREHPQAEDIVGFFANTLVLRSDVDVDAAFAEVLATVRSTCLDSFSHREMPFDRLVEELRPPRDLSRTPLFQVMFALLTTPGVTLELPELRVEPIELTDGSAKFDLWLSGVPTESGVRLRLEYSTGLFDDETIERLLGQYLDMLSAIAGHPDLPVTQLFEGAEAGDDERTHGPSLRLEAHSIVDLLAAHTERAPSDVAVGKGDDQLTFRDLHDRATSLAQVLRSAGAGLGAVVAVHLPRTQDLVVGMLAVLMARASVLPLGPGMPTAQASAMLADTEPAILLTTAELAESLPWHRVVLADAARPKEPQSTTPPAPDDPACVLYPSGTVEGGAVVLPHLALVAMIAGIGHRIGVTENDVVAAVNESDAIAVLELFLAPAFGGRTVVAAHDAESLRTAGPTLMLAAAPAWRAVLATDWVPAPQTRVVCAGEPFEAELVQLLLDSGAQVWRAHGVAEAAIVAGAERIDTAGPAPAGRPLANVSRYLLDGRLGPVRDGAVGELYLGGPGLADGYIGRPGHSAGRFLPNPFSERPGDRLLRTGIRCRYTMDGRLDVLGPADGRIRLRDHWIDPAVVEAVLAEHEEVAQAAVVAGEFGDDTQLVGWLVRAGKSGADAELARRIRTETAERVPEHLVPPVFGMLEALPTTREGAIDSRALRARQSEAVYGTTDRTPPRNRAERVIAGVFGDLLDIAEPGVHANFFGLGGHSLLAAKVIAQVRKDFGVLVPVREFFKRPTVAGLAAAVGAATDKQATDATGAALAGISDDEVTRLLSRMR
jgi:non-ribosomal peptide synthetase component F